MDVNLIIGIIGLFLSLLYILILKENLIRNIYRKIKTLVTVYLFWSKEDRIKAKEIRKKYQLPKDSWIKDMSFTTNWTRTRR